MTTIAKLREIENRKTIYEILWRRAGVGIQFYEGSDTEDITAGAGGDVVGSMSQWLKASRKALVEGLTIEGYHPTFEDAVDAEYARL